MKRFLSAVVCLALVLTMLPAVALFSAQAAEEATYTYMAQTPASIIPVDNGTKGAWYNNGSTFVTDPGSANYIEMVADGYKDAGAMHVYQDDVANNDMSLGMFLGGQPAGTYTMKMYVKGDLGLMDQTCTFFIPGADNQSPKLHNFFGTTDVADWTEVSYQVNVPNDFYYLIFSFSKYNWKTDFYVDNLQLINSSGVNVLGNSGNFYALGEVTTNSAESGQWIETALLDTEKVSGAYNSHTGVWTPMFPTGNPEGTFSAWNSEHYAEIVADGYADAGSLHLVSCPGNNTGLAINAGMIPGQTYTLGFYAKGTVNTGKVLGMYANGDGTIIADTASFLPGWNYYSHTFTAGLSQINIVAADWGWVDILVDNITLTDANGVDLLAGYGDFYTDEDPNLVKVPAAFDDSIMTGAYSCPDGKWVPMYPAGAPDSGTWCAWDATHYSEIVAEGHKDAGALHMKSDIGKNVAVAFNAGMIPGQTYTLGLWAKGTSNSGSVMISYGNGDFSIIGASAELGADWTYYEVGFTSSLSQINLLVRDWGVSDVYIDNITLKDASGKDLLAGYGDFYTLQDPTVETMTINTEVPQASWGGAPKGQWFMMYELGTPTDESGTWPAWDATHYGEIVAEGYKDIGALHLISDARKNTAVAIGADMVAGESYKLSFWAKGVANTGRVLFSYGNGDVVVIETGDQLGADWTYYETTIVANRNQLNLVAADWGSVDIYIDNITLTDAAGNDLLESCGNFCQKIQEEEPEQPVEPEVEGLAVISNQLERAYRWYWNGVTYEATDHSTVDIAAIGAEDNGSLHIWQSAAAPVDNNLGLVTTMASDLEEGAYTLSMKVKGVFYNTEGFYVYPAYCNDQQLAELSVNNKLKNADGVTFDGNAYTAADWVELTWTLPANPADGSYGFTYLALSFSKYNVGEYWIDNIRVLDPAGNDMLGGVGSFMDSGSEYFPVILPATGAEILNSNTMYYQISANEANVTVSNHVESSIICGDQNFTVTHNGVTQAASDTYVTMPMAGDPIVFAVTSTASSMDVPGNVLEMIQRAGEFNIYNVTVAAPGCAHTSTTTTTEDATCDADGSVTVICDDCGEVISTDVIPAIGHKYESTVTPPTATEQGYTTHTCTVCGDSYVDSYVDPVVPPQSGTSKLMIRGASLTLGADLKVNFTVHKDCMATFDNVYFVFTLNGEDITVSDYTFNAAGNSIFSLPGIAPRMMNDVFDIKLYGTYQGVEFVYTNTYYAANYCNTEVKKNHEAKLKTLIVDLLNFGTEHQKYMNYNLENPINGQLTAAEQAYASTQEITANNILAQTGTTNGASFRGASLTLSDAVFVRYTVKCEDLTGVTLEVSVDNNTYSIPADEFVFNGTANTYYVYFKNLPAKRMRAPIDATVCRNGEAISKTATYSVESYVANVETNDVALYNLCIAMMRYGDAAQAYLG